MNKLKNLKFISLLLCSLLIFQQTGFAQVASVELNIAGHFASLGRTLSPDKFRPLHLRSLSFDQSNNNFKLLLDKGDTKNFQDKQIRSTAQDLLDYFFVGLALPNDSFWVNLRPDAPSDIIDPLLAQTEVGKILLEADLQLKKDTAQATHPGTPEGKQYWDKLYQKAGEIYGNQNVTIPTLTRPWIVPNEIIIRESTDSAYVYKATLKVMLEQDYLKDSTTYAFKDEREKQLNEYSTQLIRKTIIPRLTQEINNAKRYAPLRQVYYSLILAQWFKARNQGKNTSYAKRINRKDLATLQAKTAYFVNTYFNAYKDNFTKGEYNVQEPRSTPYGQVIRSYFSGGITGIAPAIPVLGQSTAGMVTVVPDVNGLSPNNPNLTQVSVKDSKINVATADNATAEKTNSQREDLRSKAEQVLGRVVSEEELDAIQEAHEVGSGHLLGEQNPDGTFEKNLDPNLAFTPQEIVVKRRTLEKAGFSQEEIDRLIKYGVAGVLDWLRRQTLDRLRKNSNVFSKEDEEARKFLEEKEVNLDRLNENFKDIIKLYGYVPFKELCEGAGENAWKMFQHSLPTIKGSFTTEEFKLYWPDLVRLAIVAGKNGWLLFLYGIPVVKELFTPEEFKLYWPDLMRLDIAAGERAWLLFQYGLPAVKHLITDQKSLNAVGDDLIRLAIALGENAEVLLQHGLPALKPLITDQKSLNAVGDDLMRLDTATGERAWVLFQYGLPAIKELFTPEKFKLYWPDLVRLDIAAGETAGELFQHGLPAVKEFFTPEEFKLYWPDLVRLGIAAGKVAGELFRDVFPAVKHLITDQKSLNAVGDDLIRLAIALGENSGVLLQYGFLVVKPLITDQKSLNAIGNDLIRLATASGEKAWVLFQHSLPALKELFTPEEFKLYWPDLVRLGIAAGKNAWTLFLYGLPAVKHLIVDQKSLNAVGDDLIRLAIATGENAGTLFQHGLPAVKHLITDQKSINAIGDDLMRLAIAAGKNTVVLFQYGLPALKELFTPEEFKLYWPDLVRLGIAAGKKSWTLFQHGLLAVKPFITDQESLSAVGDDLVRLGIAAGENAGALFQHGLPGVKPLIIDRQSLNAIGNDLIKLFQRCEGTVFETSAAINGLSKMLEKFPTSWSKFIQPVIYNQTVGAYLCLNTVKVLYENGAIESVEDLEFLKELIFSQGVSAYDILENFISKGVKEKIITKPVSSEQKIIQEFLRQSKYLILELYQAYKNNPKGFNVLLARCESIHNKIISGDTSSVEKDPFFSAMLMYVFSPVITSQREQYNNLYQSRPDRPEDTKNIPPSLQGKPVTVSTGSYILKDPARPLDESSWSVILEVVKEVNKEKVAAIDAAEVAALGKELLDGWLKSSLYNNRNELLTKLYRYYRASRNAILPESLSTIANIMALKEFIGDTQRDLISECISKYQASNSQGYQAIIESKFKVKIADPARNAKMILAMLNNLRDNPQAARSALGRIVRIEDADALDNIWDAVKDKTNSREIEEVLSNITFKAQGGKEALLISQQLQGEEYHSMQGEVSSKYEFNASGEDMNLHLITSKRKAHGVVGLNMGVCVAPDAKLWDNPNFLNVIIFNEDNTALGGIHVLIIEDNGHKYLTLPGINPSPGLLAKVNADDIYNKLISYAEELAKVLGCDAVLIPTSSTIHSNRTEMQRVIGAKKYQKLSLSKTHDFSYSPYVYSFQDCFVVSEVNHESRKASDVAVLIPAAAENPADSRRTDFARRRTIDRIFSKIKDYYEFEQSVEEIINKLKINQPLSKQEIGVLNEIKNRLILKNSLVAMELKVNPGDVIITSNQPGIKFLNSTISGPGTDRLIDLRKKTITRLLIEAGLINSKDADTLSLSFKQDKFVIRSKVVEQLGGVARLSEKLNSVLQKLSVELTDFLRNEYKDNQEIQKFIFVSQFGISAPVRENSDSFRILADIQALQAAKMARRFDNRLVFMFEQREFDQLMSQADTIRQELGLVSGELPLADEMKAVRDKTEGELSLEIKNGSKGASRQLQIKKFLDIIDLLDYQKTWRADPIERRKETEQILNIIKRLEDIIQVRAPPGAESVLREALMVLKINPKNHQITSGEAFLANSTQLSENKDGRLIAVDAVGFWASIQQFLAEAHEEYMKNINKNELEKENMMLVSALESDDRVKSVMSDKLKALIEILGKAVPIVEFNGVKLRLVNQEGGDEIIFYIEDQKDWDVLASKLSDQDLGVRIVVTKVLHDNDPEQVNRNLGLSYTNITHDYFGEAYVTAQESDKKAKALESLGVFGVVLSYDIDPQGQPQWFIYYQGRKVLYDDFYQEITDKGKIPPVDGGTNKGGIDFRFLPIVTQSVGSLRASIRSMPQASLQRLDLVQEWFDIERLVNAGITPSAERLKEYLASSCFKGNLDRDMEKIVSCISDILRMEEESCSATDQSLKDILVVLGSGRSGEELKVAFSG